MALGAHYHPAAMLQECRGFRSQFPLPLLPSAASFHLSFPCTTLLRLSRLFLSLPSSDDLESFFFSFFHLDMFFYPLLCSNTLTETSVTSSCCSLGVCTCWLKRCQGSVNRKSYTQRAHLNLKQLAGQNYTAAQKSMSVTSTSLTLGSTYLSYCIPHSFHTSFLFTYH